MNFLYFLAGFGVCYYLHQRDLLADVQIFELNSQRIRFAINGKEYQLNVGQSIDANGTQFTYDGQTLTQVR